MATDEGLAIIRSKREELKFEFIRAYLAWREAAETPGVWGSVVDKAWNEYCDARDAFIMPTKWNR